MKTFACIISAILDAYKKKRRKFIAAWRYFKKYPEDVEIYLKGSKEEKEIINASVELTEIFMEAIEELRS